jgi:hypothetical protein
LLTSEKQVEAQASAENDENDRQNDEKESFLDVHLGWTVVALNNGPPIFRPAGIDREL